MANPHLNADPGTIIAFPGEIFGLGAKLLGGWAEIQCAEGVQRLIVWRLYDYSYLLGDLRLHSRDFHWLVLPGNIGKPLFLQQHDVVHPNGHDSRVVYHVFLRPVNGLHGVVAGMKGYAIGCQGRGSLL